MNKVLLEYKAKLDNNKQLGKRLPTNTLKGLIAAKRQKYKLDNDVQICIKTIKARVYGKPKNLTPLHPGTPSPLIKIEKIVVKTACQMAKI